MVHLLGVNTLERTPVRKAPNWFVWVQWVENLGEQAEMGSMQGIIKIHIMVNPMMTDILRTENPQDKVGYRSTNKVSLLYECKDLLEQSEENPMAITI